MEILAKIVDDLNELLEAEVMNNEQFKEICQLLQDQPKVRFRLLDFDFFNVQRLSIINSERLNLAGGENYMAISNLNNLEKKCMKHIRFKKYFRMEKSMFYSDENILVYFHTGTAKNDQIIFSRLTLPKVGFFINPNTITTRENKNV